MSGTPSFSKNVKQNIDPYQDVVITVGANGALYLAITRHVKSGDEVIVIEPFYTCYKPIIASVSGIIRYIPLCLKSVNDILRSSDWVLNRVELESLFNTKTKAIIFNNPHNPYGKVFSLDELEEIANICKKWNVLCIADEVYERVVYEPRQHIRMASLSGMWERTITIASAGKVFLVTVWRVGWAIGPSSLIHKLQVELPFKPASVHQEAVAKLYEREILRFYESDCYFKRLVKSVETKKDYIVRILTEAGMKPILPDAGIFVVANWTSLENKIDLSLENDVHKTFKFTKWFAEHAGLLGLPISMFYENNKTIGENFVRYCFLKQEDKKLQETEKVLNKWK